MNVGIITIFDAYNYGSFLQAYAMQSFLEQNGHKVYMIDVRTNLKSVIVQKYFAKSIKRSLLKLRRFIAYRNDWKKLNIVSCTKYPNLDIALIGSDEVWNIENQSFDHSPLYYGEIPRANKIIAYAPSLGYSTLQSYNRHNEFISSIGKNITWFGARDGFTESFLKHIGISSINRVCDPTILMYDKWKNVENTNTKLPQEPYLIYYSYKEATPFKDIILQYAKEKGLKVVSVGFDYKWCDSQIIASPFDFLSLVKNASCIVTSTFHGTLFATMYQKKFIEVEPARKVVDYLDQIGIHRIANISAGYESFKSILDSDINYSEILEKFESMRETSIQALKISNII